MEEPIIVPTGCIDSLLEHRIGFGPGQQKLIRSLYILLFSEGCETIVLGLLIPKLGNEWNLDKFDKSLLITLVYLGVSIGSYLETYSDKYGRYRFLLADAIITSFFGLLSVICTSFHFFLVVRFFYGIGIGIALPLTATYITEVVPGTHRARILSISRVYWSLGCLFACVAGWILLIGNHWRMLLFVLCFPSFYAIYDILNHGRQSLRYVWAKGDIKSAKEIIDMITTENKVPEVSESELIEIMSKQNREQGADKKEGSFSLLFNQKYMKQTLILCFAWTAACFLYYAIMLMLPSILSRNSGSFSENFQYIFLIVISAVETFAFYGAKIVMDHPEYGRKRSVYLGYSIMFVLSLMITVAGESNKAFLLVVFIGLKIFATGCFMILYPYSAEIYETLVRSQAMGVFSVCGRVATTFLGIIGISALDWAGGKGLYYIFILLSFFTALFIYQMPYCTLGRKLDS